MSIKIALAGNPNSGKTTMFNDLTGSSQYVGNWPGVTVEKKEGKLKIDKEVILQDLPGIYSLSPYTLEELVSRDYLIKEKPDVIINIVDGSNLERNLYLTTQLTEIGIPVIMAINMIDIVRKNGDEIDIQKLGEKLGCEVIETSALKKIGLEDVAKKAITLAKEKKSFVPIHKFSNKVESALEQIDQIISEQVNQENKRWYAVKLFERDSKAEEMITLSADKLEQIENIIENCEKELDDDSESIITCERYEFIGDVVKKTVKRKNKNKLSTSDKIDKVVTNRFLAIPIFALVMFLVYFISISTVGTMMTDWVNESLFGDGFHITGGSAYGEKLEEFETAQEKIKGFIEQAKEQGVDVSPVNDALAFDEEEFEDENGAAIAEKEAEQEIENFITEIEDKNISATIEIGEEKDEVNVNLAEFEKALEVEEPDPAEFGTWVPGLPVLASEGLEKINTAPWLQSLIVDGIIAGVGAVLGFLPQMLVLFLCLAILEDCGYMARIAFIMDRIFRKFGLSGKSFIPMLISTGCAVPGIMASRTIENDNDRRMTIMTTTFVPCSAKLPIIALIAGAFFPGSIWVAPSAYFVGVAAIIISGIILKKTRMFAGDPAPFVMELPSYHMPGARGVLRSTFSRGWSFVKKAATIILLSTIVIWFLSSFSWGMQMVDIEESILASIGRVIAPIFAPLGWNNWKGAVASITGLIAKENVVGTFGILYGFGEVAESGNEIWTLLANDFSQLAGYSFLLFNLLCAPCFAAIGALSKEMHSAKWTWGAIGYQCGFAYVVAFIFYQLGVVFTGGGFGIGTAAAIIVLLGMIYLLIRKPKDYNKISVSSVEARR